MPKTAGPTKAELNETLENVQEVLDEALDPELTREELVAKVKDAFNMVAGEEEEDTDVDENDDDE